MKYFRYIYYCLVLASLGILIFMSAGNSQLGETISGEISKIGDKGQDIEDLMVEIIEEDKPVEEHGWLRVQDNRLVDERNRDIQLRGMSSHGLMWYPEFLNYDSMTNLKGYGANTIRIAVYSDHSDGYVENSKEVLKLTRLVIENAISAGIYVILDWHILKDKDPNIHMDEALVFFDSLSSIYGDNPSILYEICNEPNGDTDWDDIRNYAQEVIPVIRKNSPSSVIIVGTPNYSTDLDSVYGNELEYDNIMYSYHQYIHGEKDYYEVDLDRAFEMNLPVFVSEWGISHDGDEEDILEAAEDFLVFLNQEGISWINWSISNKDEPSAAIRHDSNKLKGWTYEDLTESGKLVFRYLSGNN